MNRLIWGLGVLGGIAVCAACSGGTSSTGPEDGGASSSSSGASGQGEPMRCPEFTVGTTVGPELGGSATSRGIAQAVSELGHEAPLVRDALNAQCKQIANALAAPSADQSAADAKADPRERLKAWCALAVTSLASQKAKAGGSVSIQLVPASCGVKVADKLACQSACSGVECDDLANPTTCNGGKLFVVCDGDCTDGAAVACEGKCTGTCRGSCDGVLGEGAPATCDGKCKGDCSASCQGTLAAPVSCAGKCSGRAYPFECRGGRLEGGCMVDAKCDLACDMRGAVKAECPPPAMKVTTSNPQDPAAAALLKTVIEATYPPIMAIRARAQLESELTNAFAAVATSITDLKAACIARISIAATEANEDVSATMQASSVVEATLR